MMIEGKQMVCSIKYRLPGECVKTTVSGQSEEMKGT